MAVASVEIEASDGLHAVDAQLAGHTVQVGQVHLDTADRHHAGQEEIHVPKLIPRHLQRWACQEVAGWKTEQPILNPQSCPYLPIYGHRGLIFLCLPVTKEGQVIVVMQLGLRKPGFPGTVGEAFHHLLQRKQPGCKKGFLLWALSPHQALSAVNQGEVAFTSQFLQGTTCFQGCLFPSGRGG